MIEKTDDIPACRAIRREVFVVEQSVPEEDEWDDLDGEAIHLLALDDARQPIGTARILLQGDTGKIGRVAVVKSARGTGMGAALIRAALDELRALPGITRAKLGAQTHAIGFYEKLGFTAYGPEYDDAGIPHRDMVREL
ncbi:MAG TPA: GNAT family N-acetyltransferase [Paracoccus sp. (in: a-proteobacteria)]|uniref:GNAT family N-acetyltransferase n=1 Tax=Paracoccus sp. TaxID=267 RepID=UPI002BFF1175|nr:GNAT family N-acetyltransferase [Paracoccus sp. (in: a-proteobacteria)]HWL57136.1 GNAT family N-acetyltransferase [Paracoccus sp. (in: a-proteobacteria)]